MSNTKRVSRRVVAAAAAVGLAVTLSAAPAVAWGSKHHNVSPVQCWGGYSVSSWKTSTQSRASSGRHPNGGCALVSPAYGAAIRHTEGQSGGTSSNTYALAVSGLDRALGGWHNWGNMATQTNT